MQGMARDSVGPKQSINLADHLPPDRVVSDADYRGFAAKIMEQPDRCTLIAMCGLEDYV